MNDRIKNSMRVEGALCLLAAVWAVGVFADAAAPETHRVLFAAVVYHHGVRTPRGGPVHPALQWTWSEGAQRLTSEGLRSDFELGKEVRRRYKSLVRRNATWLTAADAECALASAEAVARGMFGEMPARQAPVVHGSVGKMMTGWKACPAAQQAMLARMDGEWQMREASVDFLKLRSAIATAISKPFPFNGLALDDCENLTDWILAANATNQWDRVLPEGLRNRNLARQVIDQAQWTLLKTFSDGNVLNDLVGGLLLHDVLQRMSIAAEYHYAHLNPPATDSSTPKPKGNGTAKQGNTDLPPMRVAVYAAHAANFLAFLRLLGFESQLALIPDWSEAVYVELCVRLADGNLAVRVWLKGRLAPIPSCPDGGDDCLWTNVLMMMGPYVNDSFVNVDWNDKCDEDPGKLCPTSTTSGFSGPSFLDFVPLWMVAGGFFGAIVSVLIVLVVWRWWRNRTRRTRQDVVSDIEIE